MPGYHSKSMKNRKVPNSMRQSPKQGLTIGASEYTSKRNLPDSGSKFAGGGHKFGSGKIDSRGPMKYG